MIYTTLIKKAISFSTQVHETDQKQKRKGKDIAYIVHPLSVGLILARSGASDEIVAAGILHDTLEDSIAENKITKAILIEEFGEQVADLVDSVTEQNKELPWEVRKQQALEHINKFSHGSLLIKSADILNNASELLDDYAKNGEAVFGRFNAPKEKILKNYFETISAIITSWPESALVEDLQYLVEALQMIENKVTILQKPTQCHLWNKTELTDEDFNDTFDVVRTYSEDSHFSRRLVKCKHCEQLYLKEFYEEIDWVDGDDPQYITYIPVKDEREAEVLNLANLWKIQTFIPKLNRDWPKGELKRTYWVGKE